MRRHFVIGIVGTEQGREAPAEVCDFILEFTPRMVIGIKYCPFCGSKIDYSKQTLRSLE